ncbi:hypothetical protein [Novosphingobium ginsenosidimutans]|uniref:DUF3883 domain-containing protein n=1 Tax=Novosphingobium ginsenosidimutans TaxID=1176536 RepID=A0A5B8S4I1_9SPHN|nr:hypothetical protein [Novosphingobium ginsenosidimutans]QEA15627.1 hypothetical protein FRF71_05470 [Novosphingobium ginsenosidimutans]
MIEDVPVAGLPPREAGQQTARKAVQVLLAKDARYHCPTGIERKALLVGYAMRGMTLYGAAFDVLRLNHPIALTDAEAIARSIDAITVCEIKSTNRANIGPELKGYMFNITAAEHLTAQSVGARYRFVFVSTVTGEHCEMSLNEVFGRARGMYPAWHIRF